MRLDGVAKSVALTARRRRHFTRDLCTTLERACLLHNHAVLNGSFLRDGPPWHRVPDIIRS